MSWFSSKMDQRRGYEGGWETGLLLYLEMIWRCSD